MRPGREGGTTSGATWHAAGLVSRMVAGYALGTIHDYAVDLYRRIEQETGQAVSWHGCGSLRVATSPAQVDWVNHICGAVLARGQDTEIVGPEDVARLNPLYDIETAGVLAAIHTPKDGHVDPAGTCFAIAAGARRLEAEVIRHCRVTNVQRLPSGEWPVATEAGEILCEHVVNAGGIRHEERSHSRSPCLDVHRQLTVGFARQQVEQPRPPRVRSARARAWRSLSFNQSVPSRERRFGSRCSAARYRPACSSAPPSTPAMSGLERNSQRRPVYRLTVDPPWKAA